MSQQTSSALETVPSELSLKEGSRTSWKLMEFKKGIFQAWKVVENDYGHGKSWKSDRIPPIGHGIFFTSRIIIL